MDELAEATAPQNSWPFVKDSELAKTRFTVTALSFAHLTSFERDAGFLHVTWKKRRYGAKVNYFSIH